MGKIANILFQNVQILNISGACKVVKGCYFEPHPVLYDNNASRLTETH